GVLERPLAEARLHELEVDDAGEAEPPPEGEPDDELRGEDAEQPPPAGRDREYRQQADRGLVEPRRPGVDDVEVAIGVGPPLHFGKYCARRPGSVRDTRARDRCPADAASAPRQRPRRRSLPRAARRADPRPRRAPVPGALQPRVPPRLRRAAAPVPPDAAARTRGCTAPRHRPERRRHLLRGRVTQRGVVHDELSPRLRPLADGLSRRPSARIDPPAHPDVRAAGVRPPALQRVWRRQPRAARLTSPPIDSTTQEDTMLKQLTNVQVWVHDQDEALAFYTDKLGLELRQDVTVPELGNFRWVSVGAPGQSDV